jgi:hypothetical protein
LQALARALIVKAGQSDVQALKEVFDRAGGRTSSATSAPRQLTLSWKHPPPASKKPASKTRAGNSSRSSSGEGNLPSP